MYLYILDRTSNTILLHGAFPNRFELQPLVATVRDVVSGHLVLPQVIEAAAGSREGGFVEYYFDDPNDETDRADIPKVGYAREFTGEIQRPDGSVVPTHYVIGSGFYGRAADDVVSTGHRHGQVEAAVLRQRRRGAGQWRISRAPLPVATVRLRLECRHRCCNGSLSP